MLHLPCLGIKVRELDSDMDWGCRVRSSCMPGFASPASVSTLKTRGQKYDQYLRCFRLAFDPRKVRLLKLHEGVASDVPVNSELGVFASPSLVGELDLQFPRACACVYIKPHVSYGKPPVSRSRIPLRLMDREANSTVL